MFCSNCGTKLTGAFCTRCGARASEPPSPSAPPHAPLPYAQLPQYVPPPPAAKSGAGWKILIAVLATLGMLGVLAIAGVWYAVHTVKQEVKQVAASQGIDLSAIAETHRGPVRTFDTCALLTKEDLSQLLSLPVERAEGTGKSGNSECRYYSSQAQQRGQEEALAAKQKIEGEGKSGNAADQAQTVRDFGNLIRGITGAAGATNDAPMLTISIDSADPKAMVAGFKTGMEVTGFAIKSRLGSGGAPNLVTEDVQGVGDEGIFAPLFSMSVFRKGDVAVFIDARMLPGGKEAQITIAKRIFSKL